MVTPPLGCEYFTRRREKKQEYQARGSIDESDFHFTR
jgi:hypothetical protein